jgi:hypothetical protein
MLQTRRDLVGEQLANDEAEGCTAVAEGDLVNRDSRDGTNDRFAVAGDRLAANAYGCDFELGITHHYLGSFCQKRSNDALQLHTRRPCAP